METGFGGAVERREERVRVCCYSSFVHCFAVNSQAPRHDDE